MQANWDKFASCRHVSHLAEVSLMHTTTIFVVLVCFQFLKLSVCLSIRLFVRPSVRLCVVQCSN